MYPAIFVSYIQNSEKKQAYNLIKFPLSNMLIIWKPAAWNSMLVSGLPEHQEENIHWLLREK